MKKFDKTDLEIYFYMFLGGLLIAIQVAVPVVIIWAIYRLVIHFL